VQGLVHDIRHIDAMTERGKEVDVRRGGGTDIQNSQPLFDLQMLQQSGPGAGVPRYAWSGQNCGANPG
jgi:hypothetical protein